MRKGKRTWSKKPGPRETATPLEAGSSSKNKLPFMPFCRSLLVFFLSIARPNWLPGQLKVYLQKPHQSRDKRNPFVNY